MFKKNFYVYHCSGIPKTFCNSNYKLVFQYLANKTHKEMMTNLNIKIPNNILNLTDYVREMMGLVLERNENWVPWKIVQK